MVPKDGEDETRPLIPLPLHEHLPIFQFTDVFVALRGDVLFYIFLLQRMGRSWRSTTAYQAFRARSLMKR